MIKYSDKNKIPKIILQQNKLNNNIPIVKDNNISLNKNVIKINLTRDIFNKFINLSTSFTKCTKIFQLAQINGSWFGEQFIKWNISLGQIDIRMLPFLKASIVYELVSSTLIMDNIVGLKNQFFSYEDVSDPNKYEKNVTFHACLYFAKNDTLKNMNPVKAKLIIIWDEIPLIKKQTTTDDSNFDDDIRFVFGWDYGLPNSDNPVWPDYAGESGEPAG